MAMPHPSVLMLPFGCVICQRETGQGRSVDIYLNKADIENQHPAFGKKPNGHDTLADLILATKDYAAATGSGQTSVIAFADVNLHRKNPVATKDPYNAYRLHSSVEAPEQIPDTNNPAVDGRKVVMESDWFYFLLPWNVKASVKVKDDDKDDDDDGKGRHKPSAVK